MSKEHTTGCHNHGLWIGDYGLSQSMASESTYTTNCRHTVLEVKVKLEVEGEVEDVMWAWHTRLEGYSGWM